jgi:hypothetical protein
LPSGSGRIELDRYGLRWLVGGDDV